MASMWKVVGRTLQNSERNRTLLLCQQCINKRLVAAPCCQAYSNHGSDHAQHIQLRYYSDGRKGFFESIYDNLKEGLAKDSTLNENLKKFREEKQKLETSDAIKQARKKFENIESETSKGSQVFKQQLEDVKDKLSETIDEVGKSEYVKKGKEITSEFSKTAGKAGETILEHGKKIGQSSPMKMVGQGVKAVKEELDDVTLTTARPYRPPEKLLMRSDSLDESLRNKIFEPDDETVGVAMHKNSKFYESWQNFKDNNEYVNKMFDLKMKYDESDHVLVRGTRFFTDKVSSLFGGMFSGSELSGVLTEICKIDPDFDKHKFLLWCQFHVIPNILEAIIRGETAVLKDWCHEAAFAVLSQPIEHAQKQCLKFDSRILDVNNVDMVAGKMMDQGPVLIISFSSQQILAVRNAKGDVVEGDPTKIQNVTYIWVLCRDMEELNPDAAWRLLDLSASAQEQWL